MAFSECLSLDLQAAGYPITVSAVLPGVMGTQFFKDTVNFGAAGHQHNRDMQNALRETGTPVEAAAREIMTGIASGAFWVSSHPQQMRNLAAMRAQQLGELRAPVRGEMDGLETKSKA